MDRAMKIYKYNFFGTAALEKFVKKTLASEGTGDPRVFTHNKDKVSVKHIMNRLPVYYGRPMTSMYNGTFVEPEQGDVYCIGGMAKVLQGGYITIIHGYGLNFETNTTDDYKKFVNPTDYTLDEPAVSAEMFNRMTLWLGAVNYMFPDGAHLRMPIIGLGAFMSALGSTAQLQLCEAWKRQLVLAASRYPEITVEVCDFGHQFHSIRFPIVHSPGGDLFRRTVTKDFSDNYVIGDKPLVLLNAWDNMALIGNGGSQDPTIDGFMVAGTGPNKFFKNTSYLHNPMFNTHMANSDTWVQV